MLILKGCLLINRLANGGKAGTKVYESILRGDCSAVTLLTIRQTHVAE